MMCFLQVCSQSNNQPWLCWKYNRVPWFCGNLPIPFFTMHPFVHMSYFALAICDIMGRTSVWGFLFCFLLQNTTVYQCFVLFTLKKIHPPFLNTNYLQHLEFYNIHVFSFEALTKICDLCIRRNMVKSSRHIIFY